MKYIKYLVLVLGVLFLFTGCESEDKYLKNLSYNELNTKLENKETFFFVVTQDGCSHCEDFLPVLKKVLNQYEVVGYNLNLTKMTEKEHEEFDKAFNVEGTPTTIFVKDGEEISLLQRITGEADEEKVIQKLQKNDYIK